MLIYSISQCENLINRWIKVSYTGTQNIHIQDSVYVIDGQNVKKTNISEIIVRLTKLMVHIYKTNIDILETMAIDTSL